MLSSCGEADKRIRFATIEEEVQLMKWVLVGRYEASVCYTAFAMM